MNTQGNIFRFLLVSIALLVVATTTAYAQYWIFPKSAATSYLKFSETMSNVVCEWNMQSAETWSGSGQYLYSLQTNPADGSSQDSCALVLGQDETVETNDPTPTGSAGSASTYLAFDGDDIVFQSQSITNNTTLNTLHFSSADWTIAFSMQTVDTTGGARLFATDSNASSLDSGLYATVNNSSGVLTIRQEASTDTIGSSTVDMVMGEDAVVTVVHDASADQLRYYMNSIVVDTVSYAMTDNTSNASAKFHICGSTDLHVNLFCPNGTRWYGGVIFNSALDQASIETVFDIFGDQRNTEYYYTAENDGPTSNTWAGWAGTHDGDAGLTFTNGLLRGHDAIMYSSTEGIVAFRDDGDGNAGKIAYISRSGNTITSSSTFVGTSIADPFPHFLFNMGNDRVAYVAGEDVDSTNSDHWFMWLDVSGANPSVLDSVEFSSTDGSYHMNVAKLSSTAGGGTLAAIVDTDNSVGQFNLFILNASSDTVSFASVFTFDDDRAVQEYPAIARVTDTTLVAADGKWFYLFEVSGLNATLLDQIHIFPDKSEAIGEYALMPKSERSVVFFHEGSDRGDAMVLGIADNKLFRTNYTQVSEQVLWYSTNFARNIGDYTYTVSGKDQFGTLTGKVSFFTAAGDDITSIAKDIQITPTGITADHLMIREIPDEELLLAVWQDEDNVPDRQLGYKILHPLGDTPANTVLPAISGTAEEGQTLTCSSGTWVAAVTPITYAYQWQRDAVNISGATNSTYTVTSADLDTDLTCEVTATNSAGSDMAESATFTIPGAFSGYTLDALRIADVGTSWAGYNEIRITDSSNTEIFNGVLTNVAGDPGFDFDNIVAGQYTSDSDYNNSSIVNDQLPDITNASSNWGSTHWSDASTTNAANPAGTMMNFYMEWSTAKEIKDIFIAANVTSTYNWDVSDIVLYDSAGNTLSCTGPTNNADVYQTTGTANIDWYKWSCPQ